MRCLWPVAGVNVGSSGTLVVKLYKFWTDVNGAILDLK